MIYILHGLTESSRIFMNLPRSLKCLAMSRLLSEGWLSDFSASIGLGLCHLSKSYQVVSSGVNLPSNKRWEMRLWPSNKNLCGFLCRIVPCLPGTSRNIEEHRIKFRQEREADPLTLPARFEGWRVGQTASMPAMHQNNWPELWSFETLTLRLCNHRRNCEKPQKQPARQARP
jgi:hypothetical protein